MLAASVFPQFCGLLRRRRRGPASNLSLHFILVGRLRPVSWERALDTAAGLGRHKGHVGALVGGQATNEEGFLLQRLMIDISRVLRGFTLICLSAASSRPFLWE